MKLERSVLGVKSNIPCIKIENPKAMANLVIIHGYGGCKEEQLGMAWRLAEMGFSAGVVDLRGHGEHELPLTNEIYQDVEDIISQFKTTGRVVAIGHSLGGRLALVSSADFAIGISPAVLNSYSEETKNLLRLMRHYRVKDNNFGVLFEVLASLPDWQFDQRKHAIIYGSRDVPEIVESCRTLAKNWEPIEEIKDAVHSDIYNYEKTIVLAGKFLRNWLL
jgi:pimeloyl-ACP methyl ester carboxylesterase